MTPIQTATYLPDSMVPQTERATHYAAATAAVAAAIAASKEAGGAPIALVRGNATGIRRIPRLVLSEVMAAALPQGCYGLTSEGPRLTVTTPNWTITIGD